MGDHRLRTLQLGNDWFDERPGGLNRMYQELIRHLPSAGIDVDGLVVGSEQVDISTAGTVSAFAPANRPIYERLIRVRKAALRLIEAKNPDLLATHFALYAIPLVDRLRSFPTVVHFHGPWAVEAGVEGGSGFTSGVQAAIERGVYSRGARIIVLSQAFAHEVTHRYRVPEEIVRVVPGGIDSTRFNDELSRTEARERLGWPTDRPIVLSVRRQMRRMGLENLVDAVQLVAARVPEMLLMLVGSGPITGELKKRIEERGLSQNVRQLGRLPDADLPLAYRAADMSVVPTQALEGFGMITLESLASGTPALVTPVGGLPEILQLFSPECVFPGTTAEDIALVLGEALSGARCLPSGEECRRYAASQFSWPIIAGRIANIYREVLA